SQLLTTILSLVLALALFSVPTYCQKQASVYKLSPVLAAKIDSMRSTGTYLFRIMIAGKELPQQLRLAKLNARKVVEYDSVSFYLIDASMRQLIDLILPLPKVLFVEDGTRVPKEETQVNNLDLSTNRINVVHHRFPQWNGDGLTISIKENKPDTTDIDFAGRYLTTTLSSPVTSDHATNMATMIAGGGNSWYLGKGAAWGAVISSSDYSRLLPDPNAVLKQYNISVQNHSYGVDIENFYAPDAGAYDESVINNPSLLHIFSSGNSGTLASTTGAYAGITGFANLTGSFKMAKNILTVGATDSFSSVAPQSSKGPAFDGRVKPELVAFGIDGSSGAAALVSGVSLMLQQQYKQLNGTLPANALIKAVLLNSADDCGNKEVDYSNGFGSLNALNAVNNIQLGRYVDGAVSSGATQSFTLAVPAGIKKIKITLVWNDPPATANAVKALKNDLDLLLVNNATNESWKPWVLNPFPQVDSLQQPATRKRDSLNNVEQVTLNNPAAGNYDVTVKGYEVSDKQSFYIAYQFDSTDKFEWHFPTASDPVFSAAANTLRWNSSYREAKGKLDYSVDNGSTWQMIDPAVNLTAG
ncbi:MAG TPA: S8 family serine peptidase, partial [Segetibacter sp.]